MNNLGGGAYWFVFTIIYEGRLKSSLADQDTFVECDQMKFIFQHITPCGPHTSSIVVPVLGSHR